jgi:predicted RNA binding protein YcfA (HicA-like mRNA interferase family)
MPKLPRDITGLQLAKALSGYGYRVVRQTGSHIRLTRDSEKGSHHITIPAHSPLKIGTLNSILDDVANALHVEKAELVNILFD